MSELLRELDSAYVTPMLAKRARRRIIALEAENKRLKAGIGSAVEKMRKCDYVMALNDLLEQLEACDE